MSASSVISGRSQKLNKNHHHKNQHPEASASINNSQEEDIEDNAEPRDSEVDPLNGIEGVGVLALEEVGRGDERSCKGREALEALACIEPHRSIARRTEDSDVRVGGNLEAGETTADDKGTAHEEIGRASCRERV